MDGFSKGGHNQTEFIANMDFSAEFYIPRNYIGGFCKGAELARGGSATNTATEFFSFPEGPMSHEIKVG